MSLDAARRRFKRFHGREPETGDIGFASMKKRPALRVGALAGIIYETDDGQTYIHRVRKNSRPTLYVTADGSEIFIHGGRMKFTERGFVDKSPRKRSR